MTSITHTPLAASPFVLLPDLTPEEMLFAFIAVIAAMMILMKIQPVTIMAATMLYALMVHISYFGPHPVHIIMVVLIAAIVRIAAEGAIAAKNAPPRTQAKLMRVLNMVLKAVFGGRNNERPPPENN
jgi:hypothetical protein